MKWVKRVAWVLVILIIFALMHLAGLAIPKPWE